MIQAVHGSDRTPVDDPEIATTRCPACSTEFAKTESRCPDCGLNFGG